MESIGAPGVVDKVATMLVALAPGPAALTELQSRTGLPRATAHRLAVSLERHGLVRRDDAGRFCLGLELIGLGRAAAESFPLVDAARPALLALRDDTGEGVQLYVREGPDSRRCVISLQSPHGLRWIVPEGALLPVAVGSAGRVLTGDHRAGARWVDSVEEREQGVASVSAPVRARDGSVVAAVSVSGPLERLTRAPGRRFGAAVEAAAAQVEHALRGG